MENKKEKNSNKILTLMKSILFVILIFGIWYIAFLILAIPEIHIWNFFTEIFQIKYFIPWEISKIITIENKDLGDSFNILNSLVGIFTIILIYLTYKTQKEELRVTNDTFNKQKEIMEEEKFYNKLSFLLDQKEKIKNLLEYEWEDPFEYYWSSKRLWWNTLEKLINKNKQEILEHKKNFMEESKDDSKKYMFKRLKNWHMENITLLNTYTKIINAISNHVIESDQIRDIFINKEEQDFIENIKILFGDQ